MHCRPFSYVRIDGVVTLLQCEPPLLSPPGADLRSSGPDQLAYLKCLENYRMLQFVTSTRLGASSEQVVRDVNPDIGFRVFDKPTSES